MKQETNSPEDAAAALLEVLRGLAAESSPQSKRRGPVASLDTSLERDWGIDSLGRVELLARVERAFDVHLPEQVLASAETPRDLLRAVLNADPGYQAAVAAEIRDIAVAVPGAIPEHATTLIEALAWHAETTPERAHIYLYGDQDEPQEVSYADLWRGAKRIAAGLRERDLQPGQAVAIMLPTGRDYFSSFYGALLAGGIPVPIYPPARPAQIEDHLRRHGRILDNAQAAILITVSQAKAVSRLLQSQVKGLRRVVTVDDLSPSGDAGAPAAVKAHDLAFLQYTSGSTGNPKGVMLTHANLLANIRTMGEAIEFGAGDVFVSWLPLYHDMGLIGAWLGSLYYGVPLVLMSPLSFLARPQRWLWAIHRHRGTISASANFGFELCLRRIDDRDLEGLDLSSWRLAFNGAEPISPSTLEGFCERFAKYGFRRETMYPVYGLAECGLGLAFPPLGRAPIVDRVQSETLQRLGKATLADQGDPKASLIVACGQPLPGYQIRIVDPTGRELPEREVGRLEFRGPSATSGYFRNASATRALFHGEWLDSGDRAYIAAGDVYLTGRVKDLIIRGGRNIYPHELEEAVGDLTGIRKGCVAVFGSTDAASGTERLVVLAETREQDPETLERLRSQIHERAVDVIGVPVDEVALVPPHSVLKTSSGKIRRGASRELYLAGGIGRGPRTVWWQLARFALAGVWPFAQRVARVAGGFLYAGYAWALLSVLGPLTWVLVAIVPWPRWRRRIARRAARLVMRLCGVGLRVDGLDRLPRGPAVLVSNHASYLDGIVLMAALPIEFGFVAKAELARNVFTRVLLGRLGAHFVERLDRGKVLTDAQRISQAARSGHALLFFPEGTLVRMPGVLPFRAGAFTTAAQIGVPVVPIALRGTRYLLRSGSWFPRRGAVHVNIGSAIHPGGSDWSAAIALRDSAREWILQHAGEPDLARETAPAFETTEGQSI